MFDTMVEMQAPSKELRYKIVKELIADEAHRGREVWMQKIAQMTEYFLVKDLVAIVNQAVEMDQWENSKVEEHIDRHKRTYFPQSQK
jgi:SpoVK/Ycf46/Vps4 family AAA+-type ATPase